MRAFERWKVTLREIGIGHVLTVHGASGYSIDVEAAMTWSDWVLGIEGPSYIAGPWGKPRHSMSEAERQEFAA